MVLELPCSQCGQQLRVADEFAGRLARCPKCGQVSQIPATPTASPQPPASSWPPPPSSAPPSGEPTSGAAWGPPQSNPYTSNPYATPPSDVTPRAHWPPAGGPGPSFRSPHRGVLVLVLGIISFLSFFCCLFFPCAPVAWYMGARDLKLISAGQMDPAGETMTRVGMILGIITTVLLCLGIAAYAVFIAIMIATDGAKP